MPLALRPQLPSIRLLFREIFANQTEASTAHRSLHGTPGNDFGVVQPREQKDGKICAADNITIGNPPFYILAPASCKHRLSPYNYYR